MKNAIRHLLCVLVALASLSSLFAQPSTFTYQGRLTDGTGPANGVYDFEFSVFGVDSGGTALAGPLSTNGVAVSNGLFVVMLDFGPGVFTGSSRWLEISVRTNTGSSFTTLSPRTAVSPTPYAMHAFNVSSTGIAGNYGEAVNFANPANTFAGSFTGDGTSLTNVDAATLGGLSAANFWQLGGNAGTTPGVNFVGTTDNQPLILKANGQQALRLESAPETPNVIGGAEANSVSNTIRGATIAGGGLPIYPNRITADYGAIGGGTFHIVGGAWATIAGGRDNRAYAESSTVAGGYANFIDTNAFVGAIGGGYLNRLDAAATASSISGGWGNRVGTNASYAVIGGGVFNTNQANSSYATVGGGLRNQVGQGVVAGTVGGGENNRALANHATVGGGLFNTNAGPGATISGGNANTTLANDTVIGGGIINRIGSNAFSSVISGGRQNVIADASEFATVGGGRDNLAANTEATVAGGVLNNARGFSSTVSGGGNNDVSSVWAVIGGGRDNILATNSDVALIGGGYLNRIESSSPSAIIGGGSFNLIGASSPSATIDGGVSNTNLAAASSIGGGSNNTASAGASFAVIAGGSDNVVQWNYGTIGGGSGHRIDNLGAAATVAGGWFNHAGGYISTVGGGQFNQSLGTSSTVGGGGANVASGDNSTVPGGLANTAAGASSFAAGRQARANHAGTFVWADSIGVDFNSTGTNQFLIRAGGGVGINNNAPTAALHIGGTPGVDGIRFPDGTLQTSAAVPPPPAPPVPQVYFNSGGGNDPAVTNNFLTTPLAVVITNSAQKIVVTAHRSLGSVAGANSLNLYIGYRLSGSSGALTVVGNGAFGNRVPANTRVIFGLSGVITSLAPGTYQVGLVGLSSDAANWNSNEFGYTTAVVY